MWGYLLLWIAYLCVFINLERDAVRADDVNILFWSCNSTTDGGSQISYIKTDPADWIAAAKNGSSPVSRRKVLKEWGYVFGTDVPTQSLTVASPKARLLHRHSYKGKEKPVNFDIPVSLRVNGVASDWINKNTYHTDSLYNWIMLMKKTTKETFYNVVIDSNLKEPYGIAVYPQKSYLFWTDRVRRVVERASLSGDNRVVISDKGMTGPSAIAVDLPTEMLYWLDAPGGVVYKSTLGGLQITRLIVGEAVKKLVSFTVGRGHIFGAQGGEKKIGVWSSSDGDANRETAITLKLQNTVDNIHLMSSEQQPPIKSPCDGADCQICVTSDGNKKAQCLCKHGYGKRPGLTGCHKADLGGHIPPAYVYTLSKTMCFFRPWIADSKALTPRRSVQGCFGASPSADAPILVMAIPGQRSYIYTIIPKTGIVNYYLGKTLAGSTNVVIQTKNNISGLAGDWLHLNLYWLDATEKRIMVSRFDGSNQAQLLTGLAGDLRTIAVDPIRRKLFWGEGSKTPGDRIWASDLDGKNKKIIASGNITRLEQITPDLKTGLLYWTDSEGSRIERVFYQGGRRKTIYNSPTASPYGIALFEDYAAWTDKGLHSSKKSGGFRFMLKTGLVVRAFIIAAGRNKEKKLIDYVELGIKPGVVATYDLYHQKYPDAKDACSENNGGCQHLCLAGILASRKTCRCEVGFTLREDGKSCNQVNPLDDNFLLLSRRRSEGIIQVSLDGPPTATTLPVTTSPFVLSLGYDYLRKEIFWIDSLEKAIRRSDVLGAKTTTVKTFRSLSKPTSMALDVERTQIYVTDVGMSQIIRVSMDGSTQDVIVEGKIKMAVSIVLLTSDRLMFWAEWTTPSKIETADMDSGDGRRAIVDSELSCPLGLAVDVREKRLYWCECASEKISSVDIKGDGRKVLYAKDKSFNFAMVLDESFIYSTGAKGYIERFNRSSGTMDNTWTRVGFAQACLVIYRSSLVSGDVIDTSTRAATEGPKLPDFTSVTDNNKVAVSDGSTERVDLATPAPRVAIPGNLSTDMSVARMRVIGGCSVAGIVILAGTAILIVFLLKKKQTTSKPDEVVGSRGYVEFENPAALEDDFVQPFRSTDPAPTHGPSSITFPSTLNDSTAI